MPQAFEPIISENFNGGVVLSVDPLLLKPNELQQGINIRYSKAGGFTNRPGYELRELPGFAEMAGMKGGYATETEIFFVCNGKLFVTLEDVSNAFEIFSGLDTNSIFQFLEFNGTVYFYNGVDELHRISITTILTPLVAGVTASLDVRAGQGWQFTSPSTVQVVNALGADSITVSNKSNDTLTIDPASVSQAASAGDKIYSVQTIADTLAPRFAAGVEFKARFLACIPKGKVGTNYQGNLLFYGRPATGVNPDYFHDFVTSAGYIPVGDKGDITGIYKTKSFVIVKKKNAVWIVSDYDANGVPIIEPLTGAYGGAGRFSDTLVGDQLVGFSGREIKQIGEQVGLNNIKPSVNPQFDDKIYTLLRDLDEDQVDCVAIFNPAQRLYKLWVNSEGSRIAIVYDDKIDAWSFDYNKPASFAINYKGETFWGHQTEAKLFQDEIGYDDNGQDIDYYVRIFATNANSPRLSKYFQFLFNRGKLGENTTVTVGIWFDDVLTQQFSLIASELIMPVGGTPIGRNRVGGGVIGSTSAAALGYDFFIEKLLKKRKNVGKMYIDFTCSGQGQVFEINGVQIEGTYSSKFDKSIRK